MSIMQRVSNLESVNSIGFLFLNLFLDLSRSHSVFVQSIVESNSLCKAGSSRDKEISLCDYCCSFRVLLGPGSECPRADLFFPVIEEDWIADNSEDIITNSTASDCNCGLTL